MRYLGSKASVVSKVYDIAERLGGRKTVCDPFGGIGIVGAYFKARGYEVRCGDILHVANAFQTARIVMSSKPGFRRLRTTLGLARTEKLGDYLNALRGRSDSWFVREYSMERRFFTVRNAVKIDACRRAINSWSRANLLTQTERKVLLASLIESMDRVANTAGTYYAYLKSWHRKALLPFSFRFLDPVQGPRGSAMLRSAHEVVTGHHFGILYLDPPYNERKYHGYYHLPETLARGLTPGVSGKAGLPKPIEYDERFYSQLTAHDALGELLDRASFDALLFHYSDDGLIAPSELVKELRKRGRVERHDIEALGYTTTRESRGVRHSLYLVRPK